MLGFLRKPPVVVGILAASVGVPYMASSDGWKKVSGVFASRNGASQNPGAAANDPSSTRLVEPASADAILVPEVPIEGHPVVNLGEVFNFAVTKQWVVQRWPRVFTGLQEPDVKHPGHVLQGYRVPLVTGTRVDDLAGSLVYYFNYQQQLQQISFLGSTGDPRRLVQLIVQQYGLQRTATRNPAQHVYVAENVGRMIIGESDQQRQSAPHLRYEVQMTLQR